MKFQFEKDSEDRVRKLLNEFYIHTGGISLEKTLSTVDAVRVRFDDKKILLTNPRNTDDWIEVTACDDDSKFKISWQLLDRAAYINVEIGTFTCTVVMSLKVNEDYLDLD